MLGIPLLVFAGLFAMEWRRGTERPAHARRHPLVVLMALTVLGATIVHVAVIRAHFAESAVLGSFFVLLSATQLTYVFVLLAVPVRRVVLAGVLAQLCVVALWAWTRTFGLGGLGGLGGAPEPIGVLDVLASCFELGTVALGLVLLTRCMSAYQPQTKASAIRPEPARLPVTAGG